ncbi:MAG: hypothetical protein HY070_05100 [Chloroflexi bacterium]|nr:hypothetical protein [Chloroflexota bacterium]MBI3742382.1 hypothetical protein [Chloroflexota bacterium]
MSKSNVVAILRVDAAFNFFVGTLCYIFYKPIIALILFPDTNKPLYANVMGAGIMGLSIVAWLASNRPETSREFIAAGIISRLLVAPAILYWLFIGGIDLPPVWLGLLAVAAQVVLISGEALYLYSTRNAMSAKKM